MEPTSTPSRRRRLTYANVTATLALFVALGGSSFAEPARQSAVKLVTGKQIKNGTVAEPDLSKGVKTKLNKVGAPGPAGTAGAKGEPGAAGAKGDPGTPGTNGTNGTNGTDATIEGVPAGGALAGTFPAPTLAPNAVNSAALAANSVTGAKVADLSLRLADISAETEILSSQNLPSIAAGACTEFEINIIGSGSGYFALISPPGNFYNTPGLMFDWNIGINAGEDIEVHVCNASNAAIDPASGGWRAVVLRP